MGATDRIQHLLNYTSEVKEIETVKNTNGFQVKSKTFILATFLFAILSQLTIPMKVEKAAEQATIGIKNPKQCSQTLIVPY